jgi:hypothetical protein
MVLRSLHRLTPCVPRFLCVEIPTRSSVFLVDSRDVHHCPVLFSRSTDFAAPPDMSELRSLGCLIHRLGWVIDQCNFTSQAALEVRSFRPRSFR